MLSSLVVILLPLFIGCLIAIKQPVILRIIQSLLALMVYVILFVMGVSVALIDNLQQSLLAILHYSVISIIIIMLCNYFALVLLNYLYPWRISHQQKKLPSRLSMLLESLKLCAVLLAGFLFGFARFYWLPDTHQITQHILSLLLLLIGIQLRNSGMTLKQIILNTRGLIIAIVVTLSSLLAGGINALILGLPLKVGLAMASGYGWYSLSGILTGEAYGPVIGSATFFTDLAHELIAIACVPLIMRHNCQAAVGLCGATSMDFTLPVLQRSGGNEIIPVAIVHGFILTLLGPLLIALFS